MKSSSPWRLKYIRASRAVYGGSVASLLDGYLHDGASVRAANLPASQKYFYTQQQQQQQQQHGAFGSQRHQVVQLRLGSAQMLAPTSSHISNSNEAHPLFFAQALPRAAGLCVSLVSALDKLRIRRLTPLQGALIPLLLKGRHVIAHAETGTGKSFGMALACANRILRERINYRLHTAIIVPTTELALQYDKWLRHFCGAAAQVVQAAVDRVPLETQLAKLHNIQPHVLVGTPQRMADVIRASPSIIGEKLRRRVDCVILDEADIVLATDVRFGRQTLNGVSLVDRLYRSGREEVPAQLVAASATIDGRTAQALNAWMRNDRAVRLTTSFVEHTIPQTIRFYFFAECAAYPLERCLALTLRLICKEEKSPRVLLFTHASCVETVVELLRRLSSSESAPELTRWVRAASGREVAAPLQSILPDAVKSEKATHRKRPEQQRCPILKGQRDVYVKDDSSLAKLYSGTLLVGVAGHELSRGIHVSGVTHVILYGECPPTTAFVHCAGRTGRMGAEGDVVVLYPPTSGRTVQQVCGAVEVPFVSGRMADVERLLVIEECNSE